MRHSRLFLVIMIFCLCYGSWISAQEVTDEPSPEVTEEATPAPELTEEATPAPETTQEPTTTPQPTGGTQYVVKAGDTLYRIAVNNGLTTQALASANNITNPSLIYVGQVLIIPGKTSTTPTPTATPSTPSATEEPNSGSGSQTSGSYLVKAGDTLFRIAVNNKTTIAELQRINNIANINLIFIGQRLTLPGTSADNNTSNNDTDSDTDTVANADFGYGIEIFMDVSNTNATGSQLIQLGAQWVKVDVKWAEIEPLKGEFNFDALDTTVNTIDALGINIMLNVYDAPAWSRPSVVGNDLGRGTGPSDNFADFGAFMGTVATRYTGKVDAYEIWKAPNLRLYWNVPQYTNPADNGDTKQFADAYKLGEIYYVDLLKVAHDAISAADANAKIVTAGLAPVGSSDNYNFIATGTFLNNMLKAGAAQYSDAVGAIFGASAVPPTAKCCDQPPGVDSHYQYFLQYFLEILDFYQDIMARNNVADVPIYVTQFGWGTVEGGILAPAGENFEWLNYTSQEEQAIYVAQAFEEGKKLGYIGPMFLYNLNGCAVGNAEACYFSLIDSNGTARPAFGTYQSIDKASTEETGG